MHAFCLHGDFLKCLQDASESSEWDSVGICAVLKWVRIGLKFVRNSHRSPSACCLLLEKPQLTAPLCIDIQRFMVMFSMLSVPDANVCNPGCIYLQPHLQIFASWKTSARLYDFFFSSETKLQLLGVHGKVISTPNIDSKSPQTDLFGRIWREM